MGRKLYPRPTLAQHFGRRIGRLLGEPLEVSRHGQMVFEVRWRRVSAPPYRRNDDSEEPYEIHGRGRVLYRSFLRGTL
jgi:hypothetical protein